MPMASVRKNMRRAWLVLARLGGRVLRGVREQALACNLAATLTRLEGVEERLRSGEAALAREQALRGSLAQGWQPPTASPSSAHDTHSLPAAQSPANEASWASASR